MHEVTTGLIRPKNANIVFHFMSSSFSDCFEMTPMLKGRITPLPHEKSNLPPSWSLWEIKVITQSNFGYLTAVPLPLCEGLVLLLSILVQLDIQNFPSFKHIPKEKFLIFGISLEVFFQSSFSSCHEMLREFLSEPPNSSKSLYVI